MNKKERIKRCVGRLKGPTRFFWYPENQLEYELRDDGVYFVQRNPYAAYLSRMTITRFRELVEAGKIIPQ